MDPDRIDYLRAVASRARRHAHPVLLKVKELRAIAPDAELPAKGDVLLEPEELIAYLDAYRPRVKVPARTA